MKKILLSLLGFLILSNSYAQNFNFGEITHADYQYDKKQLDSNANAIVLKEFGKAQLEVDENYGRLVLIFNYHVKIKIYNKEGFSQANIVIPTYKDGSDSRQQETIQDIKASTFNYDGSNFVESPIDKKAIFTENKSKYRLLTKFTLPDIKEGSLIEYSYRLISPLIFNFKSWQFQSDIPKVYSEYVANIPANYNYNVLLRGFYKLSDQKSEINRECLRLSGLPIDCSKMTYIMKNIPAFIEEEYMTAPSNFISAIYFELSDIQSTDGAKTAYTKTWKDVDYDLIGDKKFGSQMKRKDVFKDIISEVTKNCNDDLSKAKAIYNYIKKQIKWNNYYGQYCEETVKSVIDKRSGNVGDINLSLIAALSAANIDAEAVILSTRENGTINKLYPVLSEYNYVIAKVNIADKSYLLDATDPLLPFGLLPLRCLNDKGRVINLKKSSYWIDLIPSQKSTSNYALIGKLDSEGKVKGTLSIINAGYAALNKRKEIAKYNSVDEYAESLDEKLVKTKILDQQFIDLDSLEKPLTEKYTVEFSIHDNEIKDGFRMSPFLINQVTKNPFKLEERVYPVDLGYASDERITISINLPKTYQLIEKPKDMALSLPNNNGRYLLQTDLVDNNLLIIQSKQLNKPIYQSDEYPYLKEFYTRIIQSQKTDILLKKSK